MQASPMATANSSASRQSPTSGPVRKASGQTLTSGPVCEEGERQNPEGAQALEKRRADTHHNLPGVVGHFSPFSQRSGTPPSATKPSPKSGRRSATGHQAASSSRAYQQDSNLPALRGPGSVATSTAVAFTKNAWQGSGANLLDHQELEEEEEDAWSKHLPTTRRPLLLPLPLPATEPAWLCVRRKTRRIRRSSDILKRCHRFTDLPEVPAFSSDGPGSTSQPNFMSVFTAMDALHEEMLVKLHENNS